MNSAQSGEAPGIRGVLSHFLTTYDPGPTTVRFFSGERGGHQVLCMYCGQYKEVEGTQTQSQILSERPGFCKPKPHSIWAEGWVQGHQWEKLPLCVGR